MESQDKSKEGSYSLDDDVLCSVRNPGKVFQPLPFLLPSTAGIVVPELKYADLRNVDLLPEEMNWAAEYIIRKKIEARSQGEEFGLKRFAKRYHLKPSSVRQWVRNLNHQSDSIDDTGTSKHF